ncbi:MAG: DUF748 domain-containing protein [Desulfopila sp.]
MKTAFKQFFRRRAVRIIGSICLVMVVLGALLPVGIKYYLIHWLKENGAQSASIETLSINPFLGRITLDGLNVVQHDNSILHHSTLVISIGLKSLFNRDIRIENAEYTDFFIDIQQNADGSWRYGSYSMAKSSAPQQQPVPVPAPAPAPGPAVWGFQANNVKLKNCVVHLKMPDLDMLFTIDQAELNKFSTRDGKSGTLDLVGKIDDSPLTLAIDTLRVAPDLEINGTVKMSQFNLDELAKLLASVLPTIHGMLGIDGTVKFAMSDEKGIFVDYRGALTLDAAEIDTGGVHIATSSFAWDGPLQYNAPTGKPAQIASDDASLTVNGLALNVTGAQLDLRSEAIALQGTTDLTLGDTIDISYDGSLNGKSLDLRMPDLNIKDGGLDLQGKTKVIIAENIEIGYDGSLTSKGLELKMPDLDLKNKGLDLQGKTKVTIADRLDVAYDGKLDLSGLELKMPDLGLKEETFGWQGQVSYKNETAGSQVGTKGRLALGGIDFSLGGAAPLTAKGKTVSWDGATEVTLNGKTSETKIGLDGTLQGTTLATALTAQALQLQQASVKVQTKSTMTIGKQFAMTGNSGIEVGKFALQQGKGDNALAVSLDRLTIANLANKGATTVSASALQVSKITTRVPGDLPLTVNIPAIKLAGFTTDDLATYRLKSLEIQKPTATSQLSEQNLAALGQLAGSGLVATKDGRFSADSLTLQNLSLFEPAGQKDTASPFLALAGVQLKSFSWDAKAGLASDTIQFDKLAVDLQRDKKGEMNFTKDLAAMQRSTGQAEEKKQPPKAQADKGKTKSNNVAKASQPQDTLPIRIGQIGISKGSTISFADQTLAVPYKTNLTINTFALEKLDSSKPKTKSDLLLDGMLEKKAPLRITGTISPFLANPALNLNLVLKNYPLTSLSPYTVQSVGTALAGGYLRVQNKTSMADNKIDISNKVLLAGLKTKTISPQLAKELNNQLPVPLDAALAMMRDSDGNIDLSIPISGPLDNLSVGIVSIIVTALNKAIISASSSYFVYALGPYAALAYVGMKVGEKMLQVDLPPVTFTAEQTALTAEHRDYLKRIVKILSDDKKRDLQLIPHLAPGEFAADKGKKSAKGAAAPDAKTMEKMQELAEQRLQAVSAYLVDQGIDKIRILQGDPVLEKGNEAKPTVVLKIK